jgi:hypothetical protein
VQHAAQAPLTGRPHPAAGGGVSPAGLSASSRDALWRYAGLQRDGPGLRTLAGDEHPLVRLIATAALTREESRGAHLRLDFPQRDPTMEGRHVTLEQSHQPSLESWS